MRIEETEVSRDMIGAEIVAIVALSLFGGAMTYAGWHVFGAKQPPAPGPDVPENASAPTPDAPTPASPGPVTLVQDPSLSAQIASLQKDIETLAASQAAMMEQMAEREGLLLAEMRAVNSVMDPTIVESLGRIEASVGSTAPTTDAPSPDDTYQPNEMPLLIEPQTEDPPAPEKAEATPEDAGLVISSEPDHRSAPGDPVRPGPTIRRG